MIMTEFYRHQIVKLDDAIRDAESKRDFKRMVELQKEKSEMEYKMKKDGGEF